MNPNDDKINKSDILQIDGIKTYCRNCETYVDVDIDQKDKKFICKICHKKSIMFGMAKGLNEYISNKF